MNGIGSRHVDRDDGVSAHEAFGYVEQVHRTTFAAAEAGQDNGAGIAADRFRRHESWLVKGI